MSLPTGLRPARRPHPGFRTGHTVWLFRHGEVAEEFDRIHSIQRAVQVGSVDQIIPAAALRPWIITALESGMAKALGLPGDD